MATQGHYTEGRIVDGVNVGGGVFVPDTAPTPAPVPAPTPEATPATAYKSIAAPVGQKAPGRTYTGQDGSTYDMATGELVAHGDIRPVDEGSIRSNVLNQFQAEINAQNQIYAEKLAEAKQAGLGSLGSARATQARSGLLGSDFAGAQNDKVVAHNTEIENSIMAEKAARIAEIVGKATSEGTAQIAEKRRAQQAGLDEYLKNLAGRTEQKNTNVKSFAAYLLDSKINPDEVNPAELQKIADGYGVSVADLVAGYKAEKTTRDAAQKKLDTESANTKFDQDLKTRQANLDDLYKKGQLSIDEYNAETGRINALTNKSKATGTTSGSTELRSTALTSAKQLLEKFTAGKGTSAVGKSGFLGSFGYGLIPGTDRADFTRNYDNLKSLLSLDNVKFLKGQGAVSDAERQLLADSATQLDTAQSEEQFKSTLANIVQVLSKIDATAPKTTDTATVTSETTTPPDAYTLPDGSIVHKQADGSYQ